MLINSTIQFQDLITTTRNPSKRINRSKKETSRGDHFILNMNPQIPINPFLESTKIPKTNMCVCVYVSV